MGEELETRRAERLQIDREVAGWTFDLASMTIEFNCPVASAFTLEKRPGEARSVVRGAARRRPSRAGEAGIERMAAATGVHRRDELYAGRVDDAVVGSRDRDRARLQRLAQAVEHLRLELRQLVKEEHAVMGERHFARVSAQLVLAENGQIAQHFLC